MLWAVPTLQLRGFSLSPISHLPTPISHLLVTFDTNYQTGQIAFERGEYRQAVNYLLAAVAQVEPNTAIGGEAQIWLVTALEAAGQIPEAMALCQKLANHPNLDTRQSSKRMLYIMQAPELSRRDEWLSKIPDLSHLEDREGKVGGSGNTYSPPPPPPPQSLEERYAPIDLSQVNTQANNFTAIALGFIAIVLLGLWIFAS
jgi:tetratricopeptide (TPR) repeat protein